MKKLLRNLPPVEIGDLLGAAGLFALLFAFLLFTPA
jgi:hypothetical protein